MSTICSLSETYIFLENEQIAAPAPVIINNNPVSPVVPMPQAPPPEEASIPPEVDPNAIDNFDMNSLPPTDDDPNVDDDISDPLDAANISSQPEIIPLKKYTLIQFLRDLQTKLKEEKNTYFSALDIILKFSKDWRYETLLMITSNLLDQIDEELALHKEETKKNQKGKNKK